MSERLGLVKVVEEDEGGEDLVLPAAEEVGLSEELDEGEADLEGVRAAGKGIMYDIRTVQDVSKHRVQYI